MAKTEPTSAPPVSFIDNPHAPCVYVTGLTGYFLNEGVVQLTFETGYVDHSTSPGPINRTVVVRLAMPLPAAQRACLGIYDFLKAMGHDPTEVIQTAGDPGKPQ